MLLEDGEPTLDAEFVGPAHRARTIIVVVATLAVVSTITFGARGLGHPLAL